MKRRRVLCALIGILAIVLQVILPASARASNGMWVEICGEFGAETVLLDVSAGDGSPVTPKTCAECCPCVLGGATSIAFPQTPVAAAAAPGGVFLLHGTCDPDVPQAAARFWPETRGPPLARSNSNLLDLSLMTSIRFSTGGAWS